MQFSPHMSQLWKAKYLGVSMVQSAEEFSYLLEGQGRREDLIRSRDREIIERCKEVCETWMRSSDGNFKNMYKAIDQVLREIS